MLARPHGYEITINTVDEGLSHVVNPAFQTMFQSPEKDLNMVIRNGWQ